MLMRLLLSNPLGPTYLENGIPDALVTIFAETVLRGVTTLGRWSGTLHRISSRNPAYVWMDGLVQQAELDSFQSDIGCWVTKIFGKFSNSGATGLDVPLLDHTPDPSMDVAFENSESSNGSWKRFYQCTVSVKKNGLGLSPHLVLKNSSAPGKRGSFWLESIGGMALLEVKVITDICASSMLEAEIQSSTPAWGWAERLETDSLLQIVFPPTLSFIGNIENG
ncbi:hypothetical protein F5141DRAFT_1066659 [Pisolithus sp. B1]|nr:hypothetical protein F5141DRAFT_1066659 [Pisolithus sp. B1]